MKRFQMDRPLMIKRWRQEWVKHGRDFGDCHCGAGMGTMRKHRPFEQNCSKSCYHCALLRAVARLARRKERYGARKVIVEELLMIKCSADRD